MSELAILAADTALIDQADDPAMFVVLACERAKDWLTQAVEHGDIDQTVQIKDAANHLRLYTLQQQLGKDAELAAAEIVRRAERGIGVAIRRGQEAGEIVKRGEIGRYRSGVPTGTPENPEPKPSPTQWLTRGNDMTTTYAVTDDVTDEQFDEAIDEAKAEKNLSRANVVRKVKGEPTPVRAPRETTSTKRRYDASQRPEVLRGTRHFDSNRAIEQIILGSGMSDSVAELIDYSALDRDRLEGWVSSLSEVIKSLQTLNNNLKKELTQ